MADKAERLYRWLKNRGERRLWFSPTIYVAQEKTDQDRMDDFRTQLWQLAKDLLAAMPKTPEPGVALPWMKRAKYLAASCIQDGRLSPQLSSLIPLDQQPEFVEAAGVVGDIGGSYNTGKVTNARDALSLIVGTLAPDAAVKAKRPFTVASIDERAQKLTVIEKHILDTAWNYYVSTGKSYPIRGAQRLVGKTPIGEVLEELGGNLIYETEGGDLALTIYGALLTGHGTILVNLLIAVLDLVRDLDEKDSSVSEFDSEPIRKKFGEEQTRLLCKLLQFTPPRGFPFYLKQSNNDGKVWSAVIRNEVINLSQSENSVSYLDSLFAHDYTDDKPVSYRARLQQQINPPPGQLVHPKVAPPVPSSSSHIDTTRIEQLRTLKPTKFDCARLIAMCEELNECAARGNAHAVIYLTRAILDHVPPILGCKNFGEVAANYGGAKSFKKAMERLEKHSRNVADLYLHEQITKSEVVPNLKDVIFDSELNLLLSECYRLLK